MLPQHLSHRKNFTPPAGWLTRPQAAAALQIGLRTLDRWRSMAFGPVACLVPKHDGAGHLACLYRRADIEAFRALMLPRGKWRPVRLQLPEGGIKHAPSTWLKPRPAPAPAPAPAQAEVEG